MCTPMVKRFEVSRPDLDGVQMKNLFMSIAILLAPLLVITAFVLGIYLELPYISAAAAIGVFYLLYLKKYNKNLRLRL